MHRSCLWVCLLSKSTSKPRLLCLQSSLEGLPKQQGIDIDEFTVEMTKAAHRLKAGRGIHTKDGGNWNKVWREFRAKYPNATREQMMNQAKQMILDFGIDAGDIMSDFIIIADPCSSAARQSRYYDPSFCGPPIG